MTITALPDAPNPLTDSQATYNSKALAFTQALPAFGTEANALASDVNADAVSAAADAITATTQAGIATTGADTATTQAGIATTQAGTATTQAGIATTQAGIATTKAGEASTSAANALSSANAAAASAASISDGPVTSVNGQTGVVVLELTTITLDGNLSPYVTQATTLTITNYDSATTYAVSATGGTVSRVGDTITYTAGATAGTYALDITAGAALRSVAITVLAASVVAPTITSPANGATDVVETPTFTTAAFATIGGADTHLNTDWELWTGAGRTGTLVWSSLADASNKLSITLPGGLVPVSSTRYLTVRHRGTALGASAYTTHSYTTSATYNAYIATPTATPSSFGDAFEGGFYAGMIWNQIVQSSSSKTLGTGTQAFTVPDMSATPLVYEGQTLEVRSRANPVNKFIGTVASAIGTTLTLNVSSIGGSGTFSDWSVMSKFRLIVAPKSSGEHAGTALKNATTAFPTATQTLSEGWLATEAMRTADTSTVYPAAHWARGLNIGGKTDWYIPARDELELCWRNLKPTADNNYTTADRPTAATPNYTNLGSTGGTEATHGLNKNSSPTGAAYTTTVPGQVAATTFRTGGAEAFEYGSTYYWSSTEYSATYAWLQGWNSSYPGRQNSNGKADTCRVRASRRSII